MPVDFTQALLSFTVLYGMGKLLFFINKELIETTADVVFSPFYRAGACDERRRRDKEEDDRKRVAEEEELACSDFQPPRVKVIETTHDAGKKAD